MNVDERTVAKAIAAGRIGLGTVFTLTPGLALRAWPGDGSHDHAVSRFLARSTGGRDLAIGIGTLLAMRKDAPVRGWLEAGMLADAVDAVAILGVARTVPKGRALVAFAAAAGAVVVGRRIVDAIG
ncbi:MAG: hypothetical protein QOI99_160 [Actinomycetota bacterium]|nr:hypothetical protein [Actinomycetota bacterium]